MNGAFVLGGKKGGVSYGRNSPLFYALTPSSLGDSRQSFLDVI